MAVPVKILVLRLTSISDIILTTPVVRCLEEQIWTSEVHYGTRRAYQNIIDPNTNLSGRHYLDNSLWAFIRELRAENFNYVIDLENSFLTGVIKTALGVRAYSVKNLTLRKWLYKYLKINALPDQHLVDRFLEVVQPLEIEDDEMGLDYYILYRDHIENDWLPETHQQGYVVYAIGGRHLTQRLPVPRMIELCQKINYPIILLGGKKDRAAGEEIVRALGKTLIFNGCGLFTFNQSASVLEFARLVFSHDTSLMHIAAAFGKKVYSIWGSSTPQMGYYPYQTPYVRLEKTGLACRPCSATGQSGCPKKHFRCMNDISFDFDIKELQRKKKSLE